MRKQYVATRPHLVDYILVESYLVSQVPFCQVHQHHPLNLSDHLPISMTLKPDPKMSPPPIEIPRPINWAHAVENDDVCGFAQEVSLLVSPFIYTIHQSVSELQWEITYISKGIIDTAMKYLPHKKAKKKICY